MRTASGTPRVSRVRRAFWICAVGLALSGCAVYPEAPGTGAYYPPYETFYAPSYAGGGYAVGWWRGVPPFQGDHDHHGCCGHDHHGFHDHFHDGFGHDGFGGHGGSGHGRH